MYLAWIGTCFNLDHFAIIQGVPAEGHLLLIMSPDKPGANLKIADHPRVKELLKTFPDAVKNATEVAYGLVAEALSNPEINFLDLYATVDKLQMRSKEDQEKFMAEQEALAEAPDTISKEQAAALMKSGNVTKANFSKPITSEETSSDNEEVPDRTPPQGA